MLSAVKQVFEIIKDFHHDVSILPHFEHMASVAPPAGMAPAGGGMPQQMPTQMQGGMMHQVGGGQPPVGGMMPQQQQPQWGGGFPVGGVAAPGNAVQATTPRLLEKKRRPGFKT